jgi:hypothetical protein
VSTVSRNLHPAGSDGTQGTSDADGTDWAFSHNGFGSSQRRRERLSNVVTGRC